MGHTMFVLYTEQNTKNILISNIYGAGYAGYNVKNNKLQQTIANVILLTKVITNWIEAPKQLLFVQLATQLPWLSFVFN